MTQPQRQAAFDGFRDGTFKILVATDIAARGIDVLSISHVINYDMPDDTDSYIHRIERTGRIEHESQAFTFITDKDKGVAKDLQRLLNTTVERCTVEGLDRGRLAADRPSIAGSRANATKGSTSESRSTCQASPDRAPA